MRYNKVRGIVRAKNGSQIPKFLNPAGTMPEPNTFSKGSMIPIPEIEKLDKITNIPHLLNMQQFLDFLAKNSDKSLKWKTNKAKMAALGLDYTKSRTLIGILKIGDKVLDIAGNMMESFVSNMLGGLYGLGSSLLLSKVDINSDEYNAARNLISGINPGIGLAMDAINSIGSKTLPTFKINQEMEEDMGGGYTGSFNTMHKGADLSEKTVGFFSSSKGKKRTINRSKDLHAKVENVWNTSQDIKAMANNPTNSIRNLYQLDGGWDYTMAARLGGTLDLKINFIKFRKLNLVINLNTKQVEEFKEGGNLPEIKWKPIIDDAIDYWEPVIDDIELYREGGKTKEELETPEIEETNQKNLIPEGALHKNKHHIENTEGLTLKGIPVIDNEGEQLAEIECDEWTMTLELTKTIEELYKLFYSEGLSLKEKDLLAISAGRILVELILHNTDDRTGLIDKIKIE